MSDPAQLPPARNTAQRRADVLKKLKREVDIWVASAAIDGQAHLVPLSFSWDGELLTVATATRTVTARNLARAGWARMALGPTRDVVIIEGPVEVVPVEDGDDLADVHAAEAGFDPRKSSGRYVFIRLKPRHIQAWREVNEIPGRDIMIDGEWRGRAFGD